MLVPTNMIYFVKIMHSLVSTSLAIVGRKFLKLFKFKNWKITHFTHFWGDGIYGRHLKRNKCYITGIAQNLFMVFNIPLDDLCKKLKETSTAPPI